MPSSRSRAEVQAALPADTPLPDRLRVTVAALRSSDPLRNDRRAASVAARAGTIIATMVKALPPVDARDEPTATGSIARRLWTRVSPLEPTSPRVRALDRALSLLADHELATSTFGVRIAASTWADPYLLLLTGLAVVGGPLHGGASEFVRTLLRDAVATTPETAIGQALRDGEHVPGLRALRLHGPRPARPGAARRGRALQATARAVARRAGRARRDGARRRPVPQHRLRARRAGRGDPDGARRGRDDLRRRPLSADGSRTASRSTPTASATGSAPPTPAPRPMRAA